ncbi:MAG: hypothetical protein EPN93_01935 [Spirochaetes bacterium]|nr:MAG: hypothetical protein EPN93_01935 [Spirochaetota bacterium]
MVDRISSGRSGGMNVVVKFLVFQVIIIGPFIAGYALKRRFDDPARFSRTLIRANLATIEPAIVFWSVWGLDLSRGLMLLPVAGLALCAAGLVLGLPASRALGLGGARGHMFRISAMLANHGFTLGGFACYLILGEQGLAYSFIFVSYFMPFVFLAVFPYAAHVSKTAAPATERMPIILGLHNMPLAAIAGALGLRALGIDRPAIWFPSEALLLASISVYYLTLGMNFTQGDVRSSWKEISAMSAIKFLLVPAAAWIITGLAGFEGTVRAVVIVQSFMPAAIYSVVVSVLYGLDARLASGLFVGTSVIFLVLVFPLMLLGARLLGVGI